jgi:hypothetical protein
VTAGDGGRTGESTRRDVGVRDGVGLWRNVCFTTALVQMVMLGLRRGILHARRAGSSAGMWRVIYVVVGVLTIGFQRSDAKR